MSRGSGFDLFLAEGEAVLAFHAAEEGVPPTSVRLSFTGSDPAAPLVGVEPLPGKSHYLRGDRDSVTDIPHFARVRRREAYPGIDVEYYGTREGSLEYDLIVEGANPGIVGLMIEGADALSIAASGDLVIETSVGRLVQRLPRVYQEDLLGRREITGAYRLEPSGEVSLKLGDFTAGRPLIIDPVLSFQAVIGGSQQDLPIDIAVDDAGASYVCGNTTSLDFPLANPA